MISASLDFYERLKRGDMPEILAILGSTAGSRWVFGKTYPSITQGGVSLWDGSRTYGQGTYGGESGLISAGARVLKFGSLSHQIGYSNKNFLLSLTQNETGSMQIVLDNADHYFSDLLGSANATSFLNFSMEITCGFYDIGYEDSILLFSGTITEEHISSVLKIVATGETSSLLETYILPRSGRYLNPKTSNDILPYVYGNTAENSSQGVSLCPCIDTVNFVYCLAGHALPSSSTITLYVDNEAVSTGFSTTYSGDYETQGIIAYATFDSDPGGTVSMRTTKGKESLTNPIDILQDILTTVGDTTAQNRNSFTKAKNDADALSYTCAGVMNADQPPSFWMSSILSNFLGSWYLNTISEIVVNLDSSRRDLTPAGILREHEPSRIQGMRTRGNLCNQVFVNYGYILTDVDKRFKNNANPQYLKYEDGETTKDASSQAKYGIVKKTLDLQWTRNDTTIETMQEWIIDRFAAPVWSISFPEPDIRNMIVEPGDYVAYSWESQKDEEGQPIKNQIARVLKVTRDLDALTMTFDIQDTGEYMTIEPYVWDGAHTYGEAFTTYGANRDRKDY